MEPLTTIEELRRHIATLACVEETDAPFVSCYLNLEQSKSSYGKVLEDRALAVSSTLEEAVRADFDATMHKIKAYLAEQLRPDAKGAEGFQNFVFLEFVRRC